MLYPYEDDGADGGAAGKLQWFVNVELLDIIGAGGGIITLAGIFEIAVDFTSGIPDRLFHSQFPVATPTAA